MSKAPWDEAALTRCDYEYRAGRCINTRRFEVTGGGHTRKFCIHHLSSWLIDQPTTALWTVQTIVGRKA